MPEFNTAVHDRPVGIQPGIVFAETPDILIAPQIVAPPFEGSARHASPDPSGERIIAPAYPPPYSDIPDREPAHAAGDAGNIPPVDPPARPPGAFSPDPDRDPQESRGNQGPDRPAHETVLPAESLATSVAAEYVVARAVERGFLPVLTGTADTETPALPAPVGEADVPALDTAEPLPSRTVELSLGNVVLHDPTEIVREPAGEAPRLTTSEAAELQARREQGDNSPDFHAVDEDILVRVLTGLRNFDTTRGQDDPAARQIVPTIELTADDLNVAGGDRTLAVANKLAGPGFEPPEYLHGHGYTDAPSDEAPAALAIPQSSEILVTADGGSVEGYMTHTLDGARVAILDFVGVDPANPEQGIATELVRQFVEEARVEGAEFFESVARNLSSLRLVARVFGVDNLTLYGVGTEPMSERTYEEVRAYLEAMADVAGWYTAEQQDVPDAYRKGVRIGVDLNNPNVIARLNDSEW